MTSLDWTNAPDQGNWEAGTCRCEVAHEARDSGSGVLDHARMDIRFLGIPELTETPSVVVVIDVTRAYTVAA